MHAGINVVEMLQYWPTTDDFSWQPEGYEYVLFEPLGLCLKRGFETGKVELRT